MDVSRCSIERLIRLAFQCRLISDYRMSPRIIELQQSGYTLAFDPEEARVFLQGLISGFIRADEGAARVEQLTAIAS